MAKKNSDINNTATPSDPILRPADSVSDQPTTSSVSLGIYVQSTITRHHDQREVHLTEKAKMGDTGPIPGNHIRVPGQKSGTSDHWHAVSRTWTSQPLFHRESSINSPSIFLSGLASDPSRNDEISRPRALSEGHASLQPPPGRPATPRRLTLSHLQQLDHIAKGRNSLSVWLKEEERESVWNNVGYVRVSRRAHREHGAGEGNM